MTTQKPTPLSSPATADTTDLQIVGGGLAGLVAANEAIDAGLSVRLIEKQPTAGGRAATADHHGYRLNLGPHALYLSGAMKAALDGFGIELTGTPPPLRDSLGTIGTRTGVLPAGLGSLATTKLLGPRSKVAVAKLLARVPKMDPIPLASLTVDQWFDSLTDDQDVRALLTGLINLTTYNAASDIASADAALIQLQMGLADGVIYLDGGWGPMVQALTDRLDGADGFERVTGGVRSVSEGDDGSWVCTVGSGVDGEDRRYAAATALLAPGSAVAVDRLASTELAAAAGPPVQAAVMDLGLSERPEIMVHLVLDRALYYSLHSVAGGVAPTGRHLVVLARYLRPGEHISADEAKAAMLAHAEASGVDESMIVMERYLHNVNVTGGMPTAANGGLPGRPPVAVADRPGLFVAGDWVGDTGLLADASAASATAAVRAARSIIGGCGVSGSRPTTELAAR